MFDVDCVVLRYRSLLFWLYAKPDILFPRLDARVDNMIQVCVHQDEVKPEVNCLTYGAYGQ